MAKGFASLLGLYHMGCKWIEIQHHTSPSLSRLCRSNTPVSSSDGIDVCFSRVEIVVPLPRISVYEVLPVSSFIISEDDLRTSSTEKCPGWSKEYWLSNEPLSMHEPPPQSRYSSLVGNRTNFPVYLSSRRLH